MPIIVFCDETDPEAVRGETQTLADYSDPSKGMKTSYYWTKKTYVGKCIKESERNGYHDSDFYMLVWDDETNSAKNIEFASTRGWCYPLMASTVDATEETLEKYRNWVANQEAARKVAQRKGQAALLKANRKIALEASRSHGFSYPRLLKLRKHPQYADLLTLISSKRLRSEFKKSLQARVLAWLNEANPQYSFPLSNKQLGYIKPQLFQPRYNRAYY